jgi:NADH:ubiquinone reductase (H+-translocating)
VRVQHDLTLPGHPEVFVIGDMIALDDLPGVAQVAIQTGRFAARRITDRLAGESADAPFGYHDKGSMATISRFSAVAMIGPLRLSGFVAWLLWLGVHIVYITGFKKRVTTLLHWSVSFLGSDRSERAITEQQALAREALERVGTDWAQVSSASGGTPALPPTS